MMVRSADLLARIGGGELGLMLWDLQPADADVLCDWLREDIAAHLVTIGTASIAVTVSIGIASLAEHEMPQESFTAADAALYRAKVDDQNCARLAT